MIRTVATKPFADQRPGTSGLRKQVPVFQEPGYLENFIQSIFDSLKGFEGKTLVLGGDGRFFNREAIQVVVKIAAANGFGRVVIGKGGILSTPAVSALIRSLHAFGGIILSASHNPGGPQGDFGVKYNISAGGPAPETITEAIFARTKAIKAYKIVDAPDVDIDRLGTVKVEGCEIEIVNPVTQYLSLMKTLFDFDAIRALFASGFRMRFDGLHAVTGPYAHAIFEDELGSGAGTVVNGTPLPDFGGHHPDPNPTYAKDLYDFMMSANAPDFGGASDGDGDRNMILGAKGLCHAVQFARDSVRQRGLRARLRQGARGRRALDADQRRRRPRRRQAWDQVLRDADRVEILRQPARRQSRDAVRRGELRHRLEPHPREGRRLGGAVLAQHSRPAPHACARPRAGSLGNLWAQLLYPARLRGDHSNAAHGLMAALREATTTLPGKTFGAHKVEAADDFAYHDPVDGSDAADQGIRVMFEGGSRIVYRLSGTGTVGATLRVYIERYEPPSGKLDQETQAALADLIALSHELAGIEARTGRKAPTVIT